MNSSLSLNRRLQNANFESWKIGSDFIESRACFDLPGEVYEGASDAVDFLHTRASVLRNHLIESQGRLFVATRINDDVLRITEVVHKVPGAEPQLLALADIPTPVTDPLVGGEVEAALHCSVAVLSHPASVAAASDASTPVPPSQQLLVSTGKGDLVLLQTEHDGNVAMSSAAIFPLRPASPLIGVRPFTIEAAWSTTTGHIRCVLSVLVNISANNRSSNARQPRGVCETWLVTLQQSNTEGLNASSSSEQQQQRRAPVLKVVSKQLLMVSRSPPAAAVAAASSSSEGLLIVSEPALEDDELPAGYAPATAAVTQQTEAIAPTAAAAATGSSATATAAEAGDLDDMDLSPRTLQQAAARLAQFTSDVVLGDVPQQQWTDVFKESGPTELSDAETAVDVMLFTSVTASQQQDDNVTFGSNNDNNSHSMPGQLQLTSSVSCGPHRLLAVQTLNSNPSSSSGSGPDDQAGSGLLLGLTDDVDCAVVSAQLQSAAAAAAADTTSSSSGSSSATGWSVMLSHQAYLPALAYVVAGKTQRRHLLLGCSTYTQFVKQHHTNKYYKTDIMTGCVWEHMLGHSIQADHDRGGSRPAVCAVLVEGQKYAYLYGQVAPAASHGQQQIVDMDLPAGSHILGARLLQRTSSDTAGSSAECMHLLLLTKLQLICYTIKAPH